MADREIINVGSTVDDGTGDLLRNAFQKVNNNFEQIWTKTTVDSNLSVTGFSVSSDGDLILSPADEVKIAKSIIINSDKGNYDTTIHGETLDNILFVDASAGRIGILNNTPTTTLDVTGSVNVSNTLTTMALNTTGHTVIGDAVDDTVTFNARVNSSFEPYGNQTLGTLTNRWQNAYLQNLDVSGVISGTLTGGLDPTIVLTNDINNTSIETTALDVNGSTELDDVLITGNLVVQGTTTTLETTEVLVNNSIVFEGATADDYETTITIADPTADRTITFTDADGTVATQEWVNSQSFASGSGITLTDLSVTVDSAGSANLSYDDSTGVFTYTPPDLSSYLTSVAFSDLTGTPTTIAGYGITDAFDGDYNSLTNQPTIPSAYTNSDVDTHLNQSNPTSGYVLSWNGTDYAWVAQSGGSSYGDSDVATYLNGNLDTSIIPDTNATYDIGSAEYKIRHLYLSQNSLKFVDNSDPLNIVEYSLGAPGGVLTFNGEQVGGTFGLAANTGTHTFNPASETLTFLGTTGQINAGIAANNVTLELDSDLTGLSTINTHTIPGGTGTLALTSDISSTITGSDLDMGGNKVLFANVYSAEGDLPSATTYHGMFAHVHGTGKGYFAHAGNWVALANESDIPTVPTAVSSFTNDSGYIAPVAVPTTSVGQAGDDSGLFALDEDYIYYCTAAYDGSTNIWKRVAWSVDTW